MIGIQYGMLGSTLGLSISERPQALKILTYWFPVITADLRDHE